LIQQRKLRFGTALLVGGGVVAAAGEILNTLTPDVLSSNWRLSLGLIVSGTLVLLVGLSTFASASDQVSGLGFLGSNLLVCGGLLLIIGTVALDWIILPFLINLASALAVSINGPATQTQDALNKIIASLNGLGGPVLKKLFPRSTPHIPSAHIPLANGIALVNTALLQLHLPTIDRLAWWGHFSLAGGTLTLGSLVLGLALPRRGGNLTLTSALLIVCALLNLLCQFLTAIPLWPSNVTAAALFLTLVWLGVSAWSRPAAT
jgi:hypothetical protein